MKTLTIMIGSVAALALVAADASAQSRGRVRAQGDNGMVAAGAGPQGGAYVRGRGAVHNADGSVTSASGGAVRGPNGGRAGRASTMTVNPDGSATRQSVAGGQGPNGGQAITSGETTRNADGTYSTTRNTSATGPQGATYSGQTTYDPVNGVQRNATCTNTAGQVVPCPRQ